MTDYIWLLQAFQDILPDWEKKKSLKTLKI